MVRIMEDVVEFCIDNGGFYIKFKYTAPIYGEFSEFEDSDWITFEISYDDACIYYKATKTGIDMSMINKIK